jgi:hypothetical protein
LPAAVLAGAPAVLVLAGARGALLAWGARERPTCASGWGQR